MTDDLVDRLEALGRADTPELTDGRLLAIEQRVLRSTDSGPGRRRSAILFGMAAAVVFLVAALVFAVGSGSSEPRLEFAVGVTLERPGESAGPGVAGDVLPDGTVIDIAPGGSAEVDDDRYGPGRYVVIDGRLEPLAATSSTSTTTSPARATTTSVRPVIGAVDTATTSTAPPTVTSTTFPDRTDRGTTQRRPTTTAGSVDERPSTTVTDRRRPDRATTTTVPPDPPTTARPTDRPTTTSPGDPPPMRPTTSLVAPTSSTTSTTNVPPDESERDRRRP